MEKRSNRKLGSKPAFIKKSRLTLLRSILLVSIFISMYFNFNLLKKFSIREEPFLPTSSEWSKPDAAASLTSKISSDQHFNEFAMPIGDMHSMQRESQDANDIFYNDLAFLGNNPPSTEKGLQSPNEPSSEGVSACLLIKDDNHRLIEWLAYHYHVLPLRHLIIAVDPDSKTSPWPILQRYNDTELQFVMWKDEHYMSRTEIMARYKRKLRAIVDLDNPSDELTKLHRERQKIFLLECYKQHRLLNHKWVIHVDSDEFLVFNIIEDGEPVFDETNQPLVPNPERKTLPIIGQKTALELIKQQPRSPCIPMVRLLFGAIETSESEMKSNINYPPSLARKFDTLRFYRHATKAQTESNEKGAKRVNGLGKVIVDVSRLSDNDLDGGDILSIHRPFKSVCPASNQNRDTYVQSLFRVNHYLGSWEACDAREDVRRDRSAFERKANVNEGPSYTIAPWLTSFVQEVGVSKSEYLLRGVREIEKKPSDIQAGKGCALLFFGLGRKFRDVTFPSIKKYVLESNPSCDVFAHTYNVTIAQGTRAFEDGSVIDPSEILLLANSDVDNIMFETEEDFQQKLNVSLFRTLFPKPSRWEYPTSMDNMVRMWHSIEGAWSVMEAHEQFRHMMYSRVGLFRSDVVYTHPIHISGDSEAAFIPSLMYAEKNHWKGYNTWMFYGDRIHAEAWATKRFDSIAAFLRWQKLNPSFTGKTGLHSEMFNRYLLTIQYEMPLTIKDICFQRVRSSGKILTEDCSLIKSDPSPLPQATFSNDKNSDSKATPLPQPFHVICSTTVGYKDRRTATLIVERPPTSFLGTSLEESILSLQHCEKVRDLVEEVLVANTISANSTISKTSIVHADGAWPPVKLFDDNGLINGEQKTNWAEGKSHSLISIDQRINISCDQWINILSCLSRKPRFFVVDEARAEVLTGPQNWERTRDLPSAAQKHIFAIDGLFDNPVKDYGAGKDFAIQITSRSANILFGISGDAPGVFAEFEVTLKSILLNRPNEYDHLSIHILVDSKAEVAMRTLLDRTALHGSFWPNSISVSVYNVDNHVDRWRAVIEETIPVGADEATRRHTIGAFFRMFADDILPTSVTHVLYMDTDVVIMSDLNPLFHQIRENSSAFQIGLEGCSGFMVLNVKRMKDVWKYAKKCKLDRMLSLVNYQPDDQFIYRSLYVTFPEMVSQLPTEWSIHASNVKATSSNDFLEHRQNVGMLHFNGMGETKEAYFDAPHPHLQNFNETWGVGVNYYLSLSWDIIRQLGERACKDNEKRPFDVKFFQV